MSSIEPPPRPQREVANEYGRPWPWQSRELVEEHAVERDVDLRDLAERWGTNYTRLGEWIRRHGFRTEDYRAVR